MKSGIGNVFEDHVRENRLIYEPGDLGEIYAIALAKTLGLTILITDDIKVDIPMQKCMFFRDLVHLYPEK